MFRRKRRVVEEAAAPTQPSGQYVREEVVEPPPPPRRPLIWPWLLLLLLLVLGGLALGYFLTRDDDDEPPRVPDVVGFNERMAVERLDQRGYTAEVRRQLNPNRPAGRVFDQEPDADAELERGEDVVVFVARGRGSVRVPRVVGLPVAEAFERLQTSRLRGEARDVFSRRAQGTVIRQQPAAGAEAQRGSAVVLTVSKGQQTVRVPDLVGQSEVQAGATLQRLGLSANVVRVPATDAPGTVIAQRPPAGTRRPRGSVVQINVSRGEPAVSRATVPDVVRQDELAAQETLRGAGFTVRAIDRPTADPTQDGVVVEQRPRGGQRAPRGSQVVVVVGRLG